MSVCIYDKQTCIVHLPVNLMLARLVSHTSTFVTTVLARVFAFSIGMEKSAMFISRYVSLHPVPQVATIEGALDTVSLSTIEQPSLGNVTWMNYTCHSFRPVKERRQANCFISETLEVWMVTGDVRNAEHFLMREQEQLEWRAKPNV